MSAFSFNPADLLPPLDEPPLFTAVGALDHDVRGLAAKIEKILGEFEVDTLRLTNKLANFQIDIARAKLTCRRIIDDGVPMSADKLAKMKCYLSSLEDFYRGFQDECAGKLLESAQDIASAGYVHLADRASGLSMELDGIARAFIDTCISARTYFEGLGTSPPEPGKGRIPRALASYQRAFRIAFGQYQLKSADIHIMDDARPLYRLTIAVPRELYERTKDLLSREDHVHDLVEAEDPQAIGAFAIRYEPLDHAAG